MFVDIIVITIIAVSVIVCFKKGIVLSVFNMLSAVLSVILLALLYKPASSAFKASEFGISLYESVHSRVSELLLESGNNAVSSSDLPDFIKEILYNSTENVTEAIASLSDRIMDLIVGLAAFLVLLLAVKLVFKLIPAILESITRLPVLKQANKLLGGAAGIVIGVIWSVVAIYAVGLLSLVPALEFLNEQLSQSQIMNILHTLKISNILF